MLLAIMTRIRYFGGGLQRAHAATAAPVHHPADHLPVPAGARVVADLGPHRLPGQPPPGVFGQVGEPVAARGRERRGGRPATGAAADAALGQLATVAQRVGLVEEDDHAAVPQGEPPQLTEERLHLEDADAHEHVDEGAGVDEHVRAAGLAGHRLGHQRLAGSRRPPQQQAARHVAAALLHQLGVLQEDDVLPDPLEHVVLAPDVGKPGLDVVGVVDIHPAAGHEPEDGGELAHDDQEQQDDLQHERQHVPDELGSAEQREDRRGVDDLAGHHGDDHYPEDPGQNPPDAEPGPVGDTPVGGPLEAAEDGLGPEPVVGRRVLADEEVNLPEQFQADEDEHPPARTHLDAHRVGEPDQRVVGHGRPDQDEPDQSEQEQELDPVPDGDGLAGLPVLVPGPPARRRRWRGRRDPRRS
jgi:hypothetical protein